MADATPLLHKMSLERKCKFIELLNGYMRRCPEQTYICSRCKEEVGADEISGDRCLDCIGATYDLDHPASLI